MLFAFQQLGSGILITTKSYLVRTVILGIFFFLLIPVGKLVLIKLGLVREGAIQFSIARWTSQLRVGGRVGQGAGFVWKSQGQMVLLRLCGGW